MTDRELTGRDRIDGVVSDIDKVSTPGGGNAAASGTTGVRTAESDKERYKRAFAAVKPSEEFRVQTEVRAAAAGNEHDAAVAAASRRSHMKRWVAAACAIVIALGGSTAAYAADLGGIQRTVQVWLNGEMTNATLDVNEIAGTYTITDSNGEVIESGGGVAYNPDGSERPLTAEEMEDFVVNTPDVQVMDGGAFVLTYKGRQYDITDEFADGEEYCYITLNDGGETLYITAFRDGGLASSSDKYMIPGNDFLSE